MNDIRAKFEEIWPVPEGIAWSMNIGAYVCNDAIRITQELINKCAEYDARLDTFTRCQESMGPVLSLIEEMIDDLERDLIRYPWHDRAKQIIGREK